MGGDAEGGGGNSPDTAELVTVLCLVENFQWEPQKSISVLNDWSLEVYTAPHETSIRKGTSWQDS